MPFQDIANLMLCNDQETHPTAMGVLKAVKSFGRKKRPVGRPKG